MEDALYFAQEFAARAAAFAVSNSPMPNRLLETLDLTATISLAPFDKLLRAVPLGGIRNSPKLLRVAATNWATGTVRFFDNNEVGTALPCTSELSS
jgi:hypothetical protein